MKLRKEAVNAFAMVIALVAISTMLIVGIWITTSIQAAVSQADWSTDANTTYTSVKTTTWDAFDLAVVSLIVIAAVAIISILIGGFGGMGRV